MRDDDLTKSEKLEYKKSVGFGLDSIAAAIFLSTCVWALVEIFAR